MKLKPNTRYRLSEADKAFVLELAKVGHVNLLTHQVSLRSSKKYGGSGLSFKETGGNGCPGLVIPKNWVIEYIGTDDDILHVTFGIDYSEIDQ